MCLESREKEKGRKRKEGRKKWRRKWETNEEERVRKRERGPKWHEVCRADERGRGRKRRDQAVLFRMIKKNYSRSERIKAIERDKLDCFPAPPKSLLDFSGPTEYL